MKALTEIEKRIEDVVVLPSPFAPNWHIAVCRVTDGETVSGRGPSAEAARLSCLGEAAELLSIRRRLSDVTFAGHDLLTGVACSIEAKDVTISDLSLPEDPGTEGCAAGSNLKEAERRAFLERIERHHATEWWTGRTLPRRIHPDWLRRSGIGVMVAEARVGAYIERRTNLLIIGTAGPARTVAAISRTPDGRQPVLGFGADFDIDHAARSAISELFQMELAFYTALQTDLACRKSGHHAVLARSEQLQGPRSQILNGSAEFDWPEESGGGPNEAATALDVPILIVDLTRDDLRVPVVRAHAPDLSSARPLKFISGGGPV